MKTIDTKFTPVSFIHENQWVKRHEIKRLEFRPYEDCAAELLDKIKTSFLDFKEYICILNDTGTYILKRQKERFSTTT